MEPTIKSRVFSAVRWTTLGGGLRACLQVAQVAILARLLPPSDFGLMAMVTVVLGFATLFADMGLSSAFMQRRVVTDDERNSLFWLNVAIASLIFVLVVCVSHIVSLWFGSVELQGALIFAALTLLINATGQQLRMNAEKSLNFRVVTLIEVFSAVMAFVLAVICAYSGAGFYSLVISSVACSTSNAIFAWIFLSEGWRPKLKFRLDDVRGYAGFGGALVMSNLLNEFNRNVDLMLAGRLLGAQALGYLSIPRALVFQVQGLINPIVNRVGFPVIAQVQAEVPLVRAIFLMSLNMTSSANAPLYMGMAIFAPEVVHAVLGPQWAQSTELLVPLALWGFLRATGNPAGSLLLGMGRADLSLKWNLALAFIVAPCLWLGAFYGPIGIARALMYWNMFQFCLVWILIVRPLTQATFSEYLLATLRPMLLSLLALWPTYILVAPLTQSVTRLAVGACVSASIYIALSHVLNRDWTRSLYKLIGIPRSA
ncbi:MOP flippase family protein [Pseudoduganella sp. GCM10020061]|uniref:MOP flippase family protein n=1 Tax=Pseudoduganella sp. GCM10020061 TaxID=3317345 RepID=UPI00362E7A1E